ncbi:glycosyltransferase family 4 protein [Geodermatophilus ruber]|uniref:Glycosyltransferase involved in cell wall bisynthesis n=1 Tax=Geodermatophilus ruber TaxID=504800 RepID=A0A1I4DJG0_9ACTN|nr:glycosyltransferase [Geodermatophilus ruber]SFK92146.1 Glycosyltransferase involved in cell wall bisynthesis [Geodermatophilus ruber]
MRLFVVAESPPTTDPVGGNGSTMITAEVLARLPDDIDLHLVYFADRPQPPDARVLARASRVTRLPVRAGRTALLTQPVTRLPRATWQRSGANAAIVREAAAHDVTYLHGLHTFAPLADLTGPVVVNEVDPWSDYWTERASEGRGPSAWYDRLQARRARRLEALAAERAAAVVVVSPTDAARLRSRHGGTVVALPNGTSRPGAGRGGAAPEPGTIAFVGTLDYPPNVEAVTRLVRDVLPRVRPQVPGVRVLLAGRRPAEDVLALAGPDVEVLGDVPDVADVFARAQLAVYPGRTGRGTKNTVGEAVGAGCPVVASVESARGHELGAHLRVGATDEELAAAVSELLGDPQALRRAREACAEASSVLFGWDEVAARYVQLFRAAARRDG